MTSPKSSDQMPQLDKFRDLADELGFDEDEAAFDNQVKRVAKAAPPADRKDD